MSFKFRTTNRMVFFTALCSFLSLVSLLNAQTVPTGERQALIALYNSTDGANWYYRGNWLDPSETEGDWYGVTVEEGHVTELLLQRNGLNGTIPPEIGYLSHLRVLNLSGYYDTWYPEGKANHINDPIPPEFGQLSNLEELNLYYLQLTHLPEEFGNLSSLKTAVLSRNQFASLPDSFGNLSSLGDLSLYGNPLLTLPDSLSNLSSLKKLTMGGYRLEIIPAVIGQIPNLEEFSFSGVSELPSGFGQLKQIRSLSISGSDAEKFPVGIGECSKLEKLYANNNRFSSLPQETTNLADTLEVLRIDHNEFTAIPQVLGSLINLRELELDSNPFSGRIPPELGNLNKLEEFNLGWTSLSGSIPPEIGNMASLKLFKIRVSEITGTLPREMGQLSELEYLEIGGEYTGTLPREMGQLSELEYLEIGGEYTGSLPAEFGNLAKLETLILEGNLTGEIPSSLGNLRKLTNLHLSGNQLSGIIPESLGNLVNLTRLVLSDNQLVGEVPSSISNLIGLRILSLSNNGLSERPLPLITAMKDLKTLDLGNNQFEGEIPPSIFNRYYRLFNLEKNSFSSVMPYESMNLRRTTDNGGDVLLDYNAFDIHDPMVRDVLQEKVGDVEATQTEYPKNLRITDQGDDWIDLEWDQIGYTEVPGGYEIYCGDVKTSDFEKCGDVSSKSLTSFRVTGLEQGTDHYLQVRSFSNPHEDNKNLVRSAFSNRVTTQEITESRFYFPLLESDNQQYTGYAVSNTQSGTTSVDLKAFDQGGLYIDSDQNPASYNLGLTAQLAKIDREIFGFQLDEQHTGWVETLSSSSDIGHLFMLGRTNQLDGGLAWNRTSEYVIFTRVNESKTGFKNQSPTISFALANPNDVWTTVRTRLNRNGEERILSGRTLPPWGSLVVPLTELFEDFDPKDGFVEFLTIEGGGIVGFELLEFAGSKTLVVLPGRDEVGREKFYSAQLASGGGWFTSINLANFAFEERSVQMQAIGNTGNPLAVPVEFTMCSRCTYQGYAADYFDFYDEVNVGSIFIQTDERRVIGDVIFGDESKLEYGAGMPLQNDLFKEAVCSHIAESDEYYTGLALFNPGNKRANITVSVYSKDGILVGSSSIELKAGHRLSQLISELISGVRGQVGGSIRILSDQPLVGQQFFGSTNDGFISSIPPVIIR